MKFKKIFIAGANGMLGTTLQNIFGTDKFLLTDIETSENVKFCDVRDIEETVRIIREYKPEVIFNFAALVDLEYCETNRDECYLTNTIASINLFNISRDMGIYPTYFISTAGIFGNDKEFYTEEDQTISTKCIWQK
jgi:dTDP-4-dehydrorhamnose reductase